MYYIEVVFAFLSFLVTHTTSAKVKDLFYSKAGSRISPINENCSYPCHENSTKMVTFDFVLPLGEGIIDLNF